MKAYKASKDFKDSKFQSKPALLKLKPNDINTLLRTGYDPELVEMMKDYNPLNFGDEQRKP